MLRVGIISAWHVHARGYVEELRESRMAEVRAIWDENPERGRAMAAEWKIDFEPDYDKFIARDDFSAVICNAPTTMHGELLLKAAAAKKNIFTEKLLATTTAEAEKIADAIIKAKLIFTISLPLRGNPYVLYVKKLVDEGGLGRVTGARFRRSHNGVSDNWLPDYWFDTALTGGGAMMDLGAHPVYILSFLFGAPKRITGLTSRPFNTASDENAVAVAEFKDGILGVMETSFVTFGVPDLLEVYGTEGSVFMQGTDVRLTTKTLDGLSFVSAKPKVLPPARPSPIRQFAYACVEYIARPDSPPYLGLEDALIMTKMIEAVYNADRNGQTVQF
ncbi:MAG: Gfo/Idh/MocA family oxidoreductase [Treponema sp.]|jgi:predicted dehydrogenase|nr:Gfo/Idh/MocA family oxidoreductase [Treponema sp.]